MQPTGLVGQRGDLIANSGDSGGGAFLKFGPSHATRGDRGSGYPRILTCAGLGSRLLTYA